MKNNSWFDVDRKGLSQLLDGRGKSFIIYEMVQNAWDQDITKVEITLEPIKGKRYYRLIVKDDDPEGYKDITDAYTLFASSNKKGDPTKRGRFNLGEKLVVSSCDEAELITTSGSVIFIKGGQRKSGRKKTEKGSIFSAVVKISKSEYEDVCDAVRMLLPPLDIDTYFNGEKLTAREPIRSFEAKLQTEKSRPDGVLTRTIRKTEVEIYSVQDEEEAHLYEMGIPVVATGDTFHVNVKQKVPLNMNRDNVTPAYLNKIRTLVYNNTYDVVDQDAVNETWVKAALSDAECAPEAVDASLDLRFGADRVIYDPSDSESNNTAISNGYAVIHGSQLSKEEWSNVRNTGTTKPAGQVFPTAHPESSPDGEPPIPYDKLTDKQKLVVDFTKRLAKRIMGIDIAVNVYAIDNHFGAWYGDKVFSYNVKRLGAGFFSNFSHNLEDVLKLIIHEFGHEYCDDHLSSKYHKALCELGAKMIQLALVEPEFLSGGDGNSMNREIKKG